jgi:DNA-directed RNA polymerase specialized sigma24 family protein
MALSVAASDVESARSGGEPLERLIAAIWPEAFHVALTILRDRGLAEDSAQEACAAIARSLPLVKSVNAFKAWAYKVRQSRLNGGSPPPARFVAGGGGRKRDCLRSK